MHRIEPSFGIMSRSSSPASSLDFYDSDPSSQEDYRPRRTTKRTAIASSSKKTTTVRLNLGAARNVPEASIANVEEDDYEDEREGGLIGRRGVDLSKQELVRDHDFRPLWVDDEGNMYVITAFFSCPCTGIVLCRIAGGLMHQHPRSLCAASSESSRLSDCNR